MDSTNPIIRRNSEETLNQELSLASHFGLSGVTLQLKHGINKNVNLARIISDKISNNNSNFQVTIFIINFYCQKLFNYLIIIYFYR